MSHTKRITKGTTLKLLGTQYPAPGPNHQLWDYLSGTSSYFFWIFRLRDTLMMIDRFNRNIGLTVATFVRRMAIMTEFHTNRMGYLLTENSVVVA